MKTIHTLIPDIYSYLNGDHASIDLNIETGTARHIIDFARATAKHTLDLVDHKPTTPVYSWDIIRMSEVGTPCAIQFQYKRLYPELGKPPYAEPGHPSLPVKFLFGDYLEELVLFLAAEAGHLVKDKQKEVTLATTEFNTIVGHIDAMIDDYVVDIKSAADVSFQKYKREGLTADNDAFGYRYQLDGYAMALGTVKRAFLFINKHDGELLLIDRSLEPYVPVLSRADDLLKLRGFLIPNKEDPKGYGTVLPTVCSYCAFKYPCKKPDGYIISGRPVYFTELTPKGLAYVEGKTKIPPPEKVPDRETFKI